MSLTLGPTALMALALDVNAKVDSRVKLAKEVTGRTTKESTNKSPRTTLTWYAKRVW